MDTTDRFLLTGAGFTANFGCPLARGMWEIIFGHPSVQLQPRVADLLRNNFDFESSYHSIIEGDFEDREKEAISRAVIHAYEQIDTTIRDIHVRRATPPVNSYRVRELLGCFCGSRQETGFVFTLNQDLYIERQYYGGPPITIPGVLGDSRWFSSNFNMPLTQQDYVILPPKVDQSELDEALALASCALVKLHGSCNWRSASSQRQLVIGREKRDQIASEPLLARYFDVFKRSLFRPGIRVLIIGYGFADSHINEVLAKAVRDFHLKISIMTPESPDSLAAKISALDGGDTIWSGLAGFYQCDLATLCPADQSDSPEWIRLKRNFFEGRPRWPNSPRL